MLWSGLLILLLVCQEAVHAQTSDNPEEIFKAGAAAFQNGKFDEAAKNFESVLAAGPTGDALETILFTLASTYYNQKNLTKAEEYYNRCLKEFPNGSNKTKALLALSQIQAQTGRKSLSQETMKKAAEGSGDLADQAKIAQATMLSDGGNPAEAVAILKPLVAGGIKDDLSVQAAMALVEIQSKQGNLDDALLLLDQLQAASNLIRNPLQLDILAVRIGDSFLEKKERKKALRMYAIVRPRQVVMDLQKKRIEEIQKKAADTRAELQTNPKAFMEINARASRFLGEASQLQGVLDQFEKLPDTEVPVRLRQAKAYDELDQKWETILIWESLLETCKDPQVRDDATFSLAADYCALARAGDADAALDKYLADFPTGKHVEQAQFLKASVALEGGDYSKAETVFGKLAGSGKKSDNPLVEDAMFLVANSQFAQGMDPSNPANRDKYKSAVESYKKYLAAYPNGKYAEECLYRIPLSWFQSGDYGNALEEFPKYLKKYPDGTFAGDVGYRIALCYQAANKYDEVIKLCEEWVKKHNGESMQAEIMALKGDAYDKKNMAAESADAYRESVELADNDDLLKYSLFQANTQYQKTNNWEQISEMFSRFAERHPDHPAAVAAAFWVSKAKIKQGKPEEAKKFLAEKIKVTIDDRRKDAVEQLLTLLAQTCSKRPRPSLLQTGPPPSPTPPPDPNATPTPRPTATPLPPYDADGDFAKYLSEGSAGSTPLAKARIRYAQAQLAGFTKKPNRQKELMASIYKEFTADQLSAMLLAECGDIARSKGDNDKAEAFYKELMTSFPKSDLLEYAYDGMGEVALTRNQPAQAIQWFDDAVDKANADAKLADVTYGKGRGLLAQSKFDEAKKIFEQVAATKEWRGEITAKALLSLGELEEKRGKPDVAIQYYQRVFVAYQRFPNVVIPAYLKAADAFVKIGKPADAVKDLQDLLSKPRLAALPQADEARKKLQALGAPETAAPDASASPAPSQPSPSATPVTKP
jgi:TolA-binding protein